MSDEADDAQQQTELLTEAAIRRVRDRLPSRDRAGLPGCEDCGCEIDVRRRACLPGAVTCLDCQYRREMNGRNRRAD